MPTFNETASGGIVASGVAANTKSNHYIGKGSILIRGCSDFERQPIINPEFEQGDLAYSKHDARNGKYKKICVMIVESIINPKTLWIPVIKYTDTNNREWFEGDLCDYATAKSLVDAYIARKQSTSNSTDCPIY